MLVQNYVTVQYSDNESVSNASNSGSSNFTAFNRLDYVLIMILLHKRLYLPGQFINCPATQYTLANVGKIFFSEAKVIDFDWFILLSRYHSIFH